MRYIIVALTVAIIVTVVVHSLLPAVKNQCVDIQLPFSVEVTKACQVKK